MTVASETINLDTETAYWVIPADDALSVEVVTPWDDPTTVSFATAADAKVWITGSTPLLTKSVRCRVCVTPRWRRQSRANPSLQIGAWN